MDTDDRITRRLSDAASRLDPRPRDAPANAFDSLCRDTEPCRKRRIRLRRVTDLNNVLFFETPYPVCPGLSRPVLRCSGGIASPTAASNSGSIAIRRLICGEAGSGAEPRTFPA